ncbi:MAG TPA: class C sortase [Candidatus Fusicatenibacter intestinigallinarum]|uniref:Class C sortase n=1 Tax=Candidatus Fusicatenibacter intestinigallinarum TaxID=2838598 RepID=A0A9D2NBP3_9FIRM|nr:class C sortase [Candidatus Fusicatenibacter intestinigallinarum]
MKKHLSTIFLVLIFLVGAGIFAYPTIADQWNSLHQSRAIATYQEAVGDMNAEDYEAAWQAAEEYNRSIQENTFNHDAFSQEEENLRDTEYWNLLNLGGTGIMGYLSIPEIDVRMPIYHGTSDPVLQIGAGHMYGTALPIGGEGTHSVIAGHRGLPSSRLFTDLDQLEEGDKFYLHILDKVLAYQVDHISDMVDKDDTETLTSLMQKEEGEDLVTLFTCTPYGINSHRLLIRGRQVEYHGEDDETEADDSMLKSLRDYYMLYALLAIAVVLLLAVIIRLIRSRKILKRPGRKRDE